MSAHHRTAELEAQVDDLQRKILAMESLARMASHDLRTPINALAGLLHLFEGKFIAELPEDAATYLDHMKRATDQMTKLASKLAEHTEAAAAPTGLERVAISAVIRTVLDQMQVALAACGAEVTVDGDDFEVMAEPAMLRLLLSNLVSHAIAHRAPARPLHLTQRLVHDSPVARIVVTDTGTGFDPDTADAIFTSFHGFTEGSEGCDLTLATCAEICRRHGWEIDAESDGASGATFTVHLPPVPASV